MSKRFLLYYATIAALFFTLSGFISVKQIQNATLQIIFLPVTMYLFLASSQDIKRSLLNKAQPPPPVERQKGEMGKLIFFGLLFLILLGIALSNVYQRGKFLSPLPEDANSRNSDRPIIVPKNK